MRRRVLGLFSTAILMAAVLITASCGDGNTNSQAQAAPTPSSISESSPSEPDTSSPAPDISSISSPTESPSPTELSVPSGEIWQWALGRNVWSDPALQKYTQGLGRSWDTDVKVHSQGFVLTPDASGTVISVTLYNDENALGLGSSSSSFSAYKGTLPAGLSWSMTATGILNKLGQPDRSYTAGWGTQSFFTYSNQNGYALQIDLTATHQQEVPNSLMQSIKVRPA